MPTSPQWNDMINFAIREEVAAARFYTELAEQVSDQALNKTLLDFAEQENQHRRKLIDIKNGLEQLPLPDEALHDLDIADFTVEVDEDQVEDNPDSLDLQKAYLLAMQKEKAAYDLYTALAHRAPDPQRRDLFLALAAEEANHRQQFQADYDDHFLSEN